MIVLFEDNHARGLSPVALTRHVSHLLVGADALRTRIERAFVGHDIVLHGRAHIRRYHGAKGEMVEAPATSALFINARLLMTAELAPLFGADGEWIIRQDNDVVAARLDASTIAKLNWLDDALDFDIADGVAASSTSRARLYRFLWELIADNARLLADDASSRDMSINGNVSDRATLVNDGAIAIGSATSVAPGVVLDATNGPIIIERDVEIMPNAVIEGPCFIGAGSRIKIGAKIYGQTSIGPACKIGGEVENSIVLGFSNKQHDGFLGHSYLGAWVNLGADTNTSDLKNNYGPIRVTLNGSELDTGRMFLGALVGDHSKTGINTMLNTGTVIGVSANIFGGGFPAKRIPSFAWGGAEGFEKFRLDRAIELARTVMSRRSVPFTDADEALLSWLFENEQQ